MTETKVEEPKTAAAPPAEPEAEQLTSRTYYSVHGSLIVSINNGRRITEASSGLSRIVDQKVVEFTQMADGYGKLITSDPEVIAKMDARMEVLNSDVFDGTEYTRRTTPVELQIQQLQAENRRLRGETERAVIDQNRLLAKLNAESKASPRPEPKLPEAVPTRTGPPSK